MGTTAQKLAYLQETKNDLITVLTNKLDGFITFDGSKEKLRNLCTEYINNINPTAINNYAFKHCYGITKAIIPSNITSIGSYAFEYCKNMTEMVIQTGCITINNDAIYGCSGLKKITIPSSITSIGDGAFYQSRIEDIYIDSISWWLGLSLSVYTSHFISTSHNIYVNNVLLTNLIIPNDITDIGDYIFSYCKSLISVTMGSNIISIGEHTFYNCINLTNVSISDNIEYIGSDAFYGCNNLAYNIYSFDRYLGNDNNPYLVFMGPVPGQHHFGLTINNNTKIIYTRALYNHVSIDTVSIPSSVICIGAAAFSGCFNLTSIIFTGTMSQWNSINKGYGWNYNTGDYIIHCTDGDIPKS